MVLDAELAAKDAKKSDAGLMAEAQQWLEILTGEPFLETLWQV